MANSMPTSSETTAIQFTPPVYRYLPSRRYRSARESLRRRIHQ
jgi:hypothetical protein